MPEGDTPQRKDFWDKADVGGKWLIPIVVAFATIWFSATQTARDVRQKTFDSERAEKQKTFEVAIGILREPPSQETVELRKWALTVFKDVTKNAYGEVPQGAVDEISKRPLPALSQASGQLRVFIIRLSGTPTATSDQIKSALTDAGYTGIILSEQIPSLFPQSAEVRYYYESDLANAQSLSDYINQNVNGVTTIVRNKSRDPDASTHRPGDLHVYVK